jgi:hypothetical protein
MQDRHRDVIRALRDAALDTRGDSDPSTRRAVFDRAVELSGGDIHQPGTGREPTPSEGLPDALDELIDKESRHAFKVVDRDLDRLRASGLSQDAVFELIVAAAVGAGVGRFDRALDALRRSEAADLDTRGS